MAIIKSFSPLQNLSNYGTFITDANPNSDYFRITEFNETFTGGKNGFLIEGSEYLKETTEIKIEILDVDGNPVYYEPGNGIPEYYEGISKLVSVHVYEDTPIGIGKITILGELKTYEDANGVIRDIPAEWSGAYNVKWEKTFQINKNLTNESRVRFYKRPLISIDEIVKPIFNVTTPFVTQSGSVEGISEIPIAGTNLSRWTAGTLYKLKRISGPGWTSSIDENVIDLPQINYTANIIEVLNTDEVLVDRPYTINNVVTNFTQSSYTSSFEYLDGQTFEESALTGSFAKIQISNLKTFVGDVARVKVFRKSRNDVGDYVLVQESKLESTELLRDLTASGQTDISFGNFTQTNLDTYWTGSANLLPTINVDKLYASVKPSSGQIGVQTLFTSQSVSVAKDVEYTLTFKTLYSGSVDNSKSLRAYLSSSEYTQEFITLSGSAIYQTKQDITQNIIAIPTSNLADAKLVFEFNGSGWHVSNVSLKNAQETSFSPDEFTIVQDVAKNVASETFDFRFEFYDINNNYIPVDVFASKAFTGGNNFISSAKLLTFDSDRNSFRFVTGSIGNPTFQTIGFTVSRQNLVGPITYGRSVFDLTGSYIDPSVYSSAPGGPYPYPGEPTNPNDNGFIAHIDEFTGSLQNIIVGSITYTASCDGLHQHETVYRLEDGENAPGLFASSTANQFIYKATDLSLNPVNQVITFDVRRKNLGVSGTEITINSGSDFGTASPLTSIFDDPSTGVATYYLSGSSFNYTSGSATYFFTASDDYGIEYHDAVKISPIKILDGLSVNLSNENASLPAKSTGFVESGSFTLTSGSVSVKIGGEDILRNENLLLNNRFDIISATGTNCTPNDTTPDDATYGITSLTKDSGSLSLLVRYKDGAGDVTDVTKVVTYTKSKTAVPSVTITATPQAQSVLANAAGVQTGTLTDVIVSALEGSTSRFTSMTATYSGFSINPTISGNALIMNSAVMNAAEASATIVVTHTDSEGTNGQTKTIVVRATKVVTGANGANGTSAVTISVTPPSQIVTRTNTGTYSTPSAITIGVTQGSTAFTAVGGGATLADNQFKLTNIVGSASNTNSTITPTTPTTTAGTTVTFNLVYKQVGVSEVTLAQTHSVSVVLDGQTGPGVVSTGVWRSGRAYQFSTGAGTGRRDVVLWSATGNAPYNTYYATTRQHTSATGNVADGAPHQPSQTCWESLGTQDFFVAAKIGLFEESFVQNTLNIGTNNSGGVSSANITLAGGTINPYFSLGQVTAGVYNADGIFIGRDGGTSKLSLKGGSNSLTWDGANLNIVGGGTFSGNISAATGTFTGGVSGTGYSLNNSGLNLTNTNSSISIGNSVVLNSSGLSGTGFSLNTAAGVTATQGTIGGWVFDSTKISKTSTGTIEINSSDLGFFIKDGSRNAVIITDDTSFRIASSTSALSDFSGTSSANRSGPVFGQNLQFEASTTLYSNSVSTGGVVNGTEVSMTDTEISGMVNNSLTTDYLMAISTATYVQTYHWISLEVVGVGEALIASGYVFYNGTTYERSISSTGGASVVIPSAGTYSVRLKHQIGVNYLVPGESIVLKTPNFTGVNAVVGTAPRSVEICQAGLQSLYGSNQFKVDTSLSANTFLTVKGTSNFSGVTTFSSLSATNGSITNLSVSEISISSGVLTINGDIRATGDIYALASSDRRLKENIIPILNPMDKIKKIGGYTFNWNDISKKPKHIEEIGVIAQEVQQVLPQVVREKGDGFLGVDYEKIVALLIEGVKQQQEEIDELKSEIIKLNQIIKK